MCMSILSVCLSVYHMHVWCSPTSEEAMGVGETAQWLRALTALPEVLSSIPAATWWLTTICNEIRCPLLGCLKTATAYSHI